MSDETTKNSRNPSCVRCKTPLPANPTHYAPFCSERCKLLDLGAWASERYKIHRELTGEESEMVVTPSGSDTEEKL